VEDVARIVLGLEPHDLAAQVMDYLDRSGRARVVATAGTPEKLARAVRRLEPTAVVGTPDLVLAAGGLNGTAYLALETEESVASMKDAIRAGAHGFFVWPTEREQLARAALGLSTTAPAQSKRARVIAVHGPRGGVGATFVAVHLSAALADAGREVVLVDVDAYFADVAAAIGLKSEPPPRTIADLAPVASELLPGQLKEVLEPHPDGFRVLHAPHDADAGSSSELAYRSAVGLLSTTVDAVVLHLPRALDSVARSALEFADLILLVLTLDVMAFRAGRRALDLIEGLDLVGHWEIVINRASRSEIVPADVHRVFGRDPLAVIPRDRGIQSAQNRGKLIPLRGRAGRRVRRLARDVWGERNDG
jgi:Flp pilus assembly CpaE family ATPase